MFPYWYQIDRATHCFFLTLANFSFYLENAMSSPSPHLQFLRENKMVLVACIPGSLKVGVITKVPDFLGDTGLRKLRFEYFSGLGNKNTS